MRKRRLLWQLFPSFLLVTLISLAAISWYVSMLWGRFQIDQMWTDLEALARGMEDEIAPPLAAGDAALVDRLCKELGNKTHKRITVILPSGKVVGDSEENPARMENHAKRPEIAKAFDGEIGEDIRLSPTLQKRMMYLAIPLSARDGGVAGVLRVSVFESSSKRILSMNRREIAMGALVVAILAAAASLVVSRQISRPLEEVKRAADRFAAGDLSHKIPIPDSQETGALAEAMNEMAAQLADRIGALERQRNEQQAVLSSMIEGVLAVDADRRVIWMNGAAGRLVGIEPEDANGRSLQEVVRNADLQRFVSEAMNSPAPLESDIILKEDGEIYLQAHGVMLRDAHNNGIGVLVVFHDVTRLRRLENVRRDFVANVSHELRTPVTSIKGYVETLLDGAVNNPEEADQFLRIVAKQADRLNAIIEDLLTLSKIEREGERSEILLEPGTVVAPVRAAIQLCEAKAAAKNIGIDLVCATEVEARINGPLLEQAVSNLLDNAIKYSNEGGRVEVEVSRSESGAAISVRDHGCGIAHEHVPRLFERFYRVDKARSRQMGGTGLGLAIVKHIVQAHKGRVTVESELGKGSVFSVHLP